MNQPFDAVLVVSFGGPGGLEEIRPFLANVLRGRRVPPERVEEVVRHYELFGGVSPLTELTFRQARGLEECLRRMAPDLPVYVGMRNWKPYLADTLAEMSRAGIRRAIGFIAAAHGSYSSCLQYRENVREAQRELARRGLPDVHITYVDPWFEHEGFITANADHINQALSRLELPLRDQARIIFTAHSIPVPMARNCWYQRQLTRSCELVMSRLGRTDWALVYQSRSGRPTDPWLEPDINDYLRAQRAAGLQAAVIAPIGFLCDHIEVLYDLDVEAAATCRELNLPMVRAQAVNDHPAFIQTMADRVRQTWDRFMRYPPLPIVRGADLVPA
ncbi:MAG TPA: ferrochelatase [Phycisphaerae bacterium]|jgi:ferrochelatase|nr:ferrochelatase [Phycisphaerae bacterium]HOB73310.1 ferrochelatase [Phycisphaerae bacterium]HOJ55708.1 ferrochelatase [Phycisphaerae bacterium]HOL26129.1 ferrochelatase [Phycisphaerae bacterium]HPP22045.1 ferrochelatase [Phycisphaerae bacterium]